MIFYFSFTDANYQNPGVQLTIELGVQTPNDPTNVNSRNVQAQRVFVHIQLS